MEVGPGLHNTGSDTTGWRATGDDRAAFHDADPRGQTAPGPGQPNADLAQLAQDWITLWQSELSAMAADPELHAAWQTMMALWAGAMSSIVRGFPAGAFNEGARGHARSGSTPDTRTADREPACTMHAERGRRPTDAERRETRDAERAGAADAEGATPAAPAPDPRDAEIDRLAGHVAALERRLADFERGGDPPVDPKSRSRRKPRR